MIHDLIMPKMGESISEATILRWLLKEGDEVNVDQPILEIATDKVDSEITSPVQGKISKILFNENDVVPVDAVIAYILTQGDQHSEIDQSLTDEVSIDSDFTSADEEIHSGPVEDIVPYVPSAPDIAREEINAMPLSSDSKDRFYSPLVRTIAREESITIAELDGISGSGQDGRVTKLDVLQYLEQKQKGQTAAIPVSETVSQTTMPKGSPSVQGDVEIIEMDRMGRLIADHMVSSKQTSPHVTSFIEVDVTNIVRWREKNKAAFQEKYKQNITYTPIFLAAVIQAIKAFPLINASVSGYQITLKKDINIGMANIDCDVMFDQIEVNLGLQIISNQVF
jgi:2-oxoglutarate dehydrogenase E2 component (dihydrolipoamide succinyltransferase)